MNWILIALGAGGVIAVQSAVNSRLGRELASPAMATLASCATATLFVLIYCLAARAALPAAGTLLRVPAWAWFGGVLGALFVSAVIAATPKLGVGTMAGLAVTGQMAVGVILDHFGLLGLERHPISLGRLAGMALLVTGVLLLKRF